MRIVPELYCTDIAVTRNFHLNVLKMSIKYERPEEKFIYFTKDKSDLMIEELGANSRKWLTGELVRPFGRGINFQWHLNSLYEHVHIVSSESIFSK